MKTIKVDGIELSLPEKRSEPIRNLQEASMLIYGEKKIGKTSLAAEFPDAIILFFEPGGKFLSTYNQTPKNWKQFKAYLKLLEAEPKKFKTIVIDTADLCYKMCSDFICEKAGVKYPGDANDHGATWNHVSTEFMEQVNFLLNLGRGAVFLSHSEEREVKVRSSKDPITKIVTSMPKQARQVLEPVIDIWAYYRYRDNERELVIKGNEEISAGLRCPQNFVGIRKIPMGDSPKEGYENFVEAFNTTKKKSVKIKVGGK